MTPSVILSSSAELLNYKGKTSELSEWVGGGGGGGGRDHTRFTVDQKID